MQAESLVELGPTQASEASWLVAEVLEPIRFVTLVILRGLVTRRQKYPHKS